MAIFLQVQIGAESKKQAKKILNILLNKKLVTGGQTLHAPARFLWKKAIIDADYFTIFSFTVEKYKEEIIYEVKKISEEEIPMISFVKIERNEELMTWITETLG